MAEQPLDGGASAPPARRDCHHPNRSSTRWSCLLVRREALEQVRGWDEGYWFWYEDVDLSRRLAEVGSALYVPGAYIEHVGRASTNSWARHEQHKRL